MSSARSSPLARGPGRPPRSPEARAAQREKLIDCAMSAIRRVGPEVSVDEMAHEAGVSKPVLYAAFGDKHGIADAIAVEIVERSARDLIAALTEAGGMEMTDALRRAIEGFIDIVTGEPEIYGFVSRSIRTSDKGLLDNALVGSLEAHFELVAGILAPSTDPDLLRVVAHGTFGFVVGAIESWRVTRAPARDELVERLVAILARGLGADGDLTG